jgi:hypothetical protein
MMKKSILLVLSMILMTAAPCAAGPATDYSVGALTVDASFGEPRVSDNSGHTGSSSFGIDATVGIALGFAGEYKYNDTRFSTPLNGSSELKVQQFNVLTHLIDVVGDLSGFVGATQSQIVGSTKKTGAVAGLVGSMPIAPNTGIYAILQAGTQVTSSEIGVSYDLTKSAELNLSCRNTVNKALLLSDGNTEDITVRGLYGSVSYKF